MLNKNTAKILADISDRFSSPDFNSFQGLLRTDFARILTIVTGDTDPDVQDYYLQTIASNLSSPAKTDVIIKTLKTNGITDRRIADYLKIKEDLTNQVNIWISKLQTREAGQKLTNLKKTLEEAEGKIGVSNISQEIAKSTTALEIAPEGLRGTPEVRRKFLQAKELTPEQLNAIAKLKTISAPKGVTQTPSETVLIAPPPQPAPPPPPTGPAPKTESAAAGLAKTGLWVAAKKVIGKIAAAITTALGQPELAPVVDKITQKAADAVSYVARQIKKHPEIAFIIGGIPLLGGILTGSALLAAAGGVVIASAVGVAGITAVAAGTGALIASILGAVVVAIATPIIIALISVPIIVALILFIINSGAYLTPPGQSLTSASPGQGQNIISAYIDVTKTAMPNDAENSALRQSHSDGNYLEVTYTITIAPKKGTLSNIRISENCSVIKAGTGSPPSCPTQNPAIPQPNDPDYPTTIPSGSSKTFTYTRKFAAPTFEDTLTTDIFTVTADTPEQVGAIAAASATVIIGNPPTSCPNGWPTSGRLNQGAYAPSGNTHAGAEAIDIGNNLGTPILATHNGVARVVRGNVYFGDYIEITSICQDSTGVAHPFFSRYGHLSAISVNNGQAVRINDVIGAMGYTGNVIPAGPSGTHLHYEFRYTNGLACGPYPNNEPYMMPRPDSIGYVPKALPRGCVGFAQCGNTLIP